MKKYLLLFCFFSSVLRVASAQFVITADLGQMTTTYGNPSNSYKYQEPSSPYVGLALGGVLYGHSERSHGLNLYGGFDMKAPFAQSAPSNAGTLNDTGNPFELGITGLVNWRKGPFSIGTGFEARSISMTDDPAYSGDTRPTQWLFGVPVVGKLTFGPGGRAFIQGGGTLYIASIADTLVTAPGIGSGLISNGAFSLDNNHASGEARVSGGYMFGSFGFRGSYIHRTIYFNVTGDPAPPGFYNTQQNMISGGIILTMF